jgi:hypothetical protein
MSSDPCRYPAQGATDGFVHAGEGEWREAIVAEYEHSVAEYEHSVAEDMEPLAACLVPALAANLIGVDDFAPRRAA